MPHITCIKEIQEKRVLEPSEGNYEITSIKNLWENISCHTIDDSSINLKFVWENKLFNDKRPNQSNCSFGILNIHLDPASYCYLSGDFDSGFLCVQSYEKTAFSTASCLLFSRGDDINNNYKFDSAILGYPLFFTEHSQWMCC